MNMPKVGDRVRLTSRMVNTDSVWMPEESLPVGSEGTVVSLFYGGRPEDRQVGVRWDCGSCLALLAHDSFEVVAKDRI